MERRLTAILAADVVGYSRPMLAKIQVPSALADQELLAAN